jgi:ribonuclease HI
MSDTWTIFTDGGARGNPGPAGYAYVIKRPGLPDIEAKAYLGKTTNNIAEYTGLVKALEHAAKLGGKKLLVKSDSELMVKQMNGEYRVKNAGLKPLHEQAARLRRQFESVIIKHIYRDQNSQADALCNEAMDNRAPLAEGQDSTPVIAEDAPEMESYPTAKSDVTSIMRALDLMKASASRWAKSGDANDPPPAEVLNQILEFVQRKDAAVAD